MTNEGVVLKALSGFYYVDCGGYLYTCRARGRFRHEKATPLVGDRVKITRLEEETGVLDEILPRKNEFQRPSVANIDQLVIVASGANPVTDPFLIDRMTATAEHKGCDCIICINKWDLVQQRELFAIYAEAGFKTISVSAATGMGLDTLSSAIAGKVSAFTGNSGVGKSSILNALEPDFRIRVGEVSEKLGRGRHTTRHVELYRLKNGAIVADTPGFSSFDAELAEQRAKEELPRDFREFRPFLDQCRYTGCTHTKERDCAILGAVAEGKISKSRHESYLRLFEQAKEWKPWN